MTKKEQNLDVIQSKKETQTFKVTVNQPLKLEY